MDAKQQNIELQWKHVYFQHILIISAITFIPGIESTSFIVQNNCPYTIWPAASSDANSQPLSTTGFVLPQGLSSTIDAPSGWKGRLWARTFCGTNSSGNFICSTGDCGSDQVYCNGSSGDQPVTLTEFTLHSFVCSSGGCTPVQDFYDVSLVHGFNVPVTITPRSSGCKSVSCPKDVNSVCPSQMTIKDGTGVVACKSACSVFKTDAYCCTGNFSTPETCKSDFARVFTSQCPEAHSYDYDQDSTTLITCPTGGDYFITFCPSSAQPKYLGMLCY